MLSSDMNRKGIEFSFAWLFAIIVGAAILAAAAYFTLNLIQTEKKQTDTVTAFEITGLLRPAQSGIDASKSSTIKLIQNTKVTFSCTSDGDFGQQRIKTSVISSIGGQANNGVEGTAKDIYLFSDKQLQGKEMKVVSLGFAFPYDIANVLVVYNKKYCFVNAPDYVSEDIERLGLNESIKETFSRTACAVDSIKVCFSEETCDVTVDIVSQSVKKNGKTVYYQDSLLYGAIIGDPDIYECEVLRIMKRAATLASLYISKADIVNPSCTSASGIGTSLVDYRAALLKYQTSGDLMSIAIKSKSLQEDNENALCRLF